MANTASRLTQMTYGGAVQASDIVYNASDQTTSIKIGAAGTNQVTENYTFDPQTGLLTNQTAVRQDTSGTTTLLNLSYEYNRLGSAGNLSGKTGHLTKTIDNLNNAKNREYEFDAVGNRTASHRSASYTHQPFNKLTATANATFSYDANGNMLSKSDSTGYWVYGWDHENRMISAGKQNKIVRYEYDALGRRVSRSGKTLGSTKYTYDGLDVVMESDFKDGIVKYQNGPGIDNKLKMLVGGQAKYFLQNHLGSTFGLVDSSGNLTSSASYDSFGNSTNSLPTRYQYTGREYDSFTGLQYNRARWYDPKIGRFISEDPIGFAGGDINVYGYVGNSPLALRDPFGLFPSLGFWPFSIHQRIGSRALNGRATPFQIDVINRANKEFDGRTQDLPFAAQHAMAKPGQSKEDARREANEFVRNRICEARALNARGLNTYAMQTLAEAIHTVQDAASPSHSDFQEAWPYNFSDLVSNLGHYINEQFDPGQGSVADENTQLVWDVFAGHRPMPTEFFSGKADSNPYASIFRRYYYGL